MTREEIINVLAQRIVNSEKITTMQAAVEYVLQWAYEHPKNPWRDASKELPKIEDEDWQCSCECLVRVKDSRFYEVAVYFPKSRVWCRYDDYEIVVRNVSYWMPIPETPKGGEE